MEYRRKSNLVFGSLTLADYGAVCYYCNAAESSDRDREVISVPGRNGDLLRDNGRYLNAPRSYLVYVPDLLLAKHLQTALLTVTGYARLEDEYEPDLYRMAYLKSAPVVERYADAATLQLTFDCKPQCYLKSGERVLAFTAAGTIYNPTLYDALPLVRAYGIGQVGIGNQTITILEASTYTDLDCELKDAYKGTTNCNNKIQRSSGSFFTLVPGSNGVSLGTGITKLEITPRWWTR